MKLALLAVASVVFTGASGLPGRAHRHGRVHDLRAVAKRQDPATAIIYVPGPIETVLVYVLDGHPISENDVRNGIANGTLYWGDDGALTSSVAGLAPVQTPPPKQDEPVPQAKIETTVLVVSPSPIPQPTLAPQAQAPPKESHEGDGDCTDCAKVFPNGTYPCGSFPTGYGAIQVDHDGLGGWTGIQDPKERGTAGFNDIYTVPHGSCNDGSCCTPGAFCSYSCPNPYLRTSWPKKQGATKQSVGGLYCNMDGKLEMADGSIANTLCAKGTDKVTVMVENKLSETVSICRTDYPGTESETIPFTLRPGEKKELACPDSATYYKWDGMGTSAQYYINNKGVAEKDACKWGDGSNNSGNWAPVNLGVGWDGTHMDMGFMSLAPNLPTAPGAKLDFTVTFTGESVINACKYKPGQYCQGLNFEECSPTKGCTATVRERGKVFTIVLSDD
ncbi:glycoside hydrolase family 132 protein [Amniculicola lignicola CBS 123094]|uniref:Glycoside hydrolase family 132 protein n=1 Tax=Amniculicola lignicola CBS 123094 TaxID=1392246 RepID=A0A6A5WGD3_9PLEO|nr:glycoside hydrolase family 132 protein [Amniculicola lignicola CBS 123094]